MICDLRHWQGWMTKALTDAFNAVYEKYVVPFRLTLEQMRLHITANAISLEHSPLLLDETGGLVGLAALGVRGDCGWVGGFGLTLPARGQGLSQLLMTELMAAAQRFMLRQVQLEVLCDNAAAIQVYQKAGFVPTRELRFLVRRAGVSDPPEPDGVVNLAAPAQILPHAARLHPVAPCWQRAAASLAATPDLQGFVVGSAAPTAYALVRAANAEVRIADIAAADIAQVPPLVAAVSNQFAGRQIVLGNEPTESPIGLALEQQGWHEPLRQYEMVYHYPTADGVTSSPPGQLKGSSD